MPKDIQCYCKKCQHFINVANPEYEIKWFEYGSYSQKKIRCKCGAWNTLQTKEDTSLSLNTDSKYYEYNETDLKWKRIREWNDYFTMYYNYDFDIYENSYTYYEDEYIYDDYLELF